MTPDPSDKSLLRCTLKKSADVTAKVVLYAAYVIDGIAAAALTIYGLIVLWNVLQAPAVSTVALVIDVMWFVVNNVVLLAVAIPWYIYAGIVAVAAIPVYSLAWCIKREITQEDRDHQSTTMQKIFSTIGCILDGAIGVYIGWLGLWFVGAGFFGLGMFILGGCFGDMIGMNIDTFLHYRKRVKEGRKE